MTAVSLTPFTGTAYLDALFGQVDSWNYGSGVHTAIMKATTWASTSLTYSFGTPTDVAYDTSGLVWTPSNYSQMSSGYQDLFEWGLGLASAVSGLTFTEVTEGPTVHANITPLQRNSGGGGDTVMPYTSTTITAGTAMGASGWMSLLAPGGGSLPTNFLGSFSAAPLFAHEILHSLGLDHTWANDALIAGGVSGAVAMPSQYRSLEYTVMTYQAYAGQGADYYGSSGYQTSDGNYPQGLMMMDIAGLQARYGANYNANSGNNVYTFSTSTGEMSIDGVAQGVPNTNKVLRTIWDGNGEDTYDFSNYSTNLNVNLTPGAWSTISTAQLAQLGNLAAGGGVAAVGNIANAMLYQSDARSMIENVIGGSGNDILQGNAGDNDITGGTGNDTFMGGSGGFDRAIMGIARSGFTLTDTTTYPTQWYKGSSSLGTADWFEISTIERVAFNDGNYSAAKLLTGTTTADAKIADFSGVHNKVVNIPLIDLDGGSSTVTAYELWNPNASARWVVNGVVQDYLVGIRASSTDTIQIETGDVGAHSNINIRAFNASGWGAWDAFTVTATADTAPVVAAGSLSMTGGIAKASTFYSASDADGDTIQQYKIWSHVGSHGYWSVDGVAQAASTNITITAAQWAHTSFIANPSYTGTELLSVQAYDGASWSAWQNITANLTATNTTGNTTAVATIADASLAHGTVNVLSKVSYSDVNGDAAVMYKLWDNGDNGGNNGHFEDGGGHRLDTGKWLEFSAADFANVNFVGGQGSNTAWIMAYDGKAWAVNSDQFIWTQPTDNVATVTSAASSNIAIGTDTLVTSHWTIPADPDGDAYTMYELWDGGTNTSSGHFLVNGVAQHENSAIQVLAADLATAEFEAGTITGTDATWLRAFDGTKWTTWTQHDFITV